jgi:hypothetical protein
MVGLLDYSGGLLLEENLSPLRGSITFSWVTQGSQSLALGLTLTAATQLISTATDYSLAGLRVTKPCSGLKADAR